jgi:hypothetical protein
VRPPPHHLAILDSREFQQNDFNDDYFEIHLTLDHFHAVTLALSAGIAKEEYTNGH